MKQPKKKGRSKPDRVFRQSLIGLIVVLQMASVYASDEGTLSNDIFTLQYSDEGITSLRRVHDVYETNYIAAGRAWGSVIIRYRSVGQQDWQEASAITPAGEHLDNAVEYTVGTLLPSLAQKSIARSADGTGNLRALNDGRVPLPRRGRPIPVFTWQGFQGTSQWVEYQFPTPTDVTTSQAYFSTGNNEGASRLPHAWQLLYYSDHGWKPVQLTTDYQLQANAFSTVNFASVHTAALRLEVTLDPNERVDLAEWRVGAIRTVASLKDLKAKLRFQLHDEALDWTITLRNTCDEVIEVGDLGLPLCFAERIPRRRGNIYTQKLIRHSYVAGYGSWVFWQRANAVGPFLVLTPGTSTHLEYFDNPGRVFTPYIHADVASEAPMARARAFGRRQPWRLPLTELKLAPQGREGSSVTYSFRLQFSPDFTGVRQVLYREHLFDTHIVPGMALPVDLPALISLHTKVDIDKIEVEYPADTRIQALGERGQDNHVYQVHFHRLGENRLMVKYQKDRWMSLEFFVMQPLETVIKKRARFLVTHMQHNDPNKPWYGAYGDWDQVHKVLRNPEDRDGLRPWLVDSSDDAGNARPVFIAAKNVFFPQPDEIASVERYIRYYLWNDLKDGHGGMQMTSRGKYPYGLYGTFPNWWTHRASDDPGRNGRAHLWRIYDYPHIIHLYYRMYQIAKYYPEMVKYKTAAEYLELAYRTAKAYWEVPKAIENWSANSVGTMNEAVIPDLIEALAREGKQAWSDTLRSYWESKVAHFVVQTPNLFGSEFAFDSTGFESTEALARYAVDNAGIHHVDPPSIDIGLRSQVPARFRDVTPEAARAFQAFQMRLNMGDRGWLETTYYQLGSDYRGSESYLLSYMSQLGGWGILDYGLYYASDPTSYLRLGYASSLSAWSLVNSGNQAQGFGTWYPDPNNDGATGGGFIPEAWGRAWIGKQMPRGTWYYSAEEDVGYVGALRTHATILTTDPLFGDIVYGGVLTRTKDGFSILSRDGLRRRLHVIRKNQRFYLILQPDAFAAEQPITISDDLSRLTFVLENVTQRAHNAVMQLAGLPLGHYTIQLDDRKVTTIEGDTTPQRIKLPLDNTPTSRVSIQKME